MGAPQANPGATMAAVTPHRHPGVVETPTGGTSSVWGPAWCRARDNWYQQDTAGAREPPYMNAKETPDDHTELHGPPSTVLAPGSPLGSRAKGKDRSHVRRSARVRCRKTPAETRHPASIPGG